MEKLMKTSKIVDKVLKIIYYLMVFMGAMSTILCILALILMAVKADVVTTMGFNSIGFSGVTFELKETVPADRTYMMATLSMALAVVVIVMVIPCYIIRLLRKVLNPMKEGQPFAGTVSKDLKKLGLAVMIGGIIANIALSVGNYIMLVSPDVMELLKSDMVSDIIIKNDINLTSIFSGILIVMLSHVFHYGENLQQQADETL